MPKVRPVSELAEKWQTVTPGREPYYRKGIEAPKENWAEEALAASPAWKAGVQEAMAKDLFAKGVAKAGIETWKKETLRKGVEQRRWATEVSVAGPKYAAKFAPFAEVINTVALPPRGAKGDPRNIDRVAAIASALRAKALELKGAK